MEIYTVASQLVCNKMTIGPRINVNVCFFDSTVLYYLTVVSKEAENTLIIVFFCNRDLEPDFVTELELRHVTG